MRKGQSIIEILIAVAIGTMMILGVITFIAPALKGSKDTEKLQTAAALARELGENVRVFAEADWHNMLNLLTGTTTYYINTGKSPFGVATGSESVLIGPTDSMLGFWKFDEGISSTTGDLGLGTSATLYNDASWVQGKAGQAVSFGGNTGHVVGTNDARLAYAGGALSASLWVKPDASDDEGNILSKPWNGSGQYNYRLFMGGGASTTISLDMTGATSYTLTAGKISSGSWHHVAFTVNASGTVKIYLDGRLSVSGTSTIISWVPGGGNGNVKLVMGCIYPYESNTCGGSTTYALKGLLDDVRMYDRTLSAAEIATLYNSPTFARSFLLDTVSRNASGTIVSAGGSVDPSTLKITVNYSWTGAATNTLIRYLARTRNFVLSQSDWSGGAGQTNSTTSLGNKFATSSNVDYSTSTGSLILPNY